DRERPKPKKVSVPVVLRVSRTSIAEPLTGRTAEKNIHSRSGERHDPVGRDRRDVLDVVRTRREVQPICRGGVLVAIYQGAYPRSLPLRERRGGTSSAGVELNDGKRLRDQRHLLPSQSSSRWIV